MPAHGRANGNGGDSAAAGRGRQRLKLVAIGYFNARHGVDADATLVRAGLVRLRQSAIEFADALDGALLKNRRIDPAQGDSELLQLAAIAYAGARHGMDADVGMVREGLAMLCQAAVGYVESLPREDPSASKAPVPLSREDAAKRLSSLHLQLGHG